MSRIEENQGHPTDRELDRLVVGQMSQADQQALLRRLEEQPEGWRRCALAFLEAQCWKREMASLARAPMEVSHRGPGFPLAGQAARRGSRWLGGRAFTVLAMAASFVVALGVGFWLGPLWRAGPLDQLAGVTGVGQQPRPIPSAVSPQPSAPAPVPWTTVRVAGPQGPAGPDGTIQVPAMERDRIDDAWLNSLPRALPADVLQALQRTGHRVQQSRELVPVPLDDGRRLVLPVDRVDVHYVGNRGYQ